MATHARTGAPRGTYLLVLEIPPGPVSIGALGTATLAAGVYVYAGSALGPGGIPARLARHCRPGKTRHWHIDYLTAEAPVVMALARADERRLECAWAQAVMSLPGATVPVPGFGSGDCRTGCPAHLIRLPDGYDVAQLEAYLWSMT